MGIAFVIAGLVLIVTGAQNTYAQLGAQLTKDMTGQGNFIFWAAAIGMVGAIGYIPDLRTFSRWFMALVLLSLFLSHKGFFSQFSAALQAGPAVAPTTATATAAQPGATPATSNPITSLGNTNTPASPATNFSNWLTNSLGLPSWLPLN